MLYRIDLGGVGVASVGTSFEGKVSAEWLERGIWLEDAPVKLADGNGSRALEMMIEGDRTFTELSDGLSAEAFAVAHGSSSQDVERLLAGDPERLTAWRKYNGGLNILRLYLKTHLWNGHFMAFGDPDRPGTDPQWIPTRAWYHLSVDPSERNKVVGEAGQFWFVRVVERTASQTPPSRTIRSRADIQAAFAAWCEARDAFPTKPEADAWAKDHGYSTGIVRTLQSAGTKLRRGRPQKGQK